VKPVLKLATGLFVAGVAVGLVQLWFSLWSPESFLRIEITLAAVLATLLVVWAVRKESADFDRQDRDHRLD
jgi:hypothetical protein